jgi:hypothetical protein
VIVRLAGVLTLFQKPIRERSRFDQSGGYTDKPQVSETTSVGLPVRRHRTGINFAILG